MLDHLIKGGTIVDGTGQSGYVGDLGIADGRIVAIGQIDDAAAETVDASGKVVCPGFIDPHTHYDAQLFWDPHATPSNLHGVTTVMAGNCGFTLAPLAAGDAAYLQRMMARVEGMPLAALEDGLAWDWETFGDYLGRLDGKVGLNVGFLVGHCALRRVVMGADAVGNEATDGQIAAMCDLLRTSIEAGGLGFSTSLAYTHDDGDGNPVPSRFSTPEEVLALCAVVGEYEGTTLEFITDGCLDRFSEDEVQLMTDMSLAAGRPLNWNVLSVDAAAGDRVAHQVASLDQAAAAGARVVALTMPTLVGMNMSFGFFSALNRLPGWNEILSLPLEERMAKLRDPQTRAAMLASSHSPEAGVFSRLAGWDTYRIGDTFAPANDGLSGRTVGEIAAERGTEPFDTILDIALADDLRTILWPHPTDDDPESWAMRAELWDHPHVMIGGSDAGAHLDRMCGTPYPTEWLADTIRGRQLTTIEKAVHAMTEVPARLFGLRDRGTLAEGQYGDVVVFDPDTVSSEDLRMVADLPGGTSRLYAGSIGIEKVYCNGVKIVDDGQATGVLPGKLMKPGLDTATVEIPGAGK
jgi:N-acyl-D-aspartate/D-glutamate deacylase